MKRLIEQRNSERLLSTTKVKEPSIDYPYQDSPEPQSASERKIQALRNSMERRAREYRTRSHSNQLRYNADLPEPEVSFPPLGLVRAKGYKSNAVK